MKMCLAIECLGSSGPERLSARVPGCLANCPTVGVGACVRVRVVQSNKGADNGSVGSTMDFGGV